MRTCGNLEIGKVSCGGYSAPGGAVLRGQISGLKAGFYPKLANNGRISQGPEYDPFAAGNPIAGARLRGDIFGAQQSAEIPPNADLRKS